MAACDHTDKVSQTLDRVQAIQDDYADSALAILDSLRIDDIESDAIRARYALMKTYVMANLKQLPPCDKSLINIAAEYYGEEKMVNEAVIAYFYKGEIAYYTGDHDAAMRDALKSLEWNEMANDIRFKAKTYDLIGNIYADACNYPQAISYNRRAAYLFKKLGRRLNEFYSLIDVTIAYSKDDFSENKALELLDSIQKNFRDIDSTALGVLHYRYLYPLSLVGKHQEAYNHYRKALSYWNGAEILQNKPLVADMFTNIGMFDSATYYLEQERLMNPDYDKDRNYHFAMLNLADSLRDVKLYYSEIKAFSELERENVRFAMRDEVSLIERDFEHDRAEREHLKIERIRLVTVFGVGLLIIAGFFVVAFIRQRNKFKLLELQKKEEKTRRENARLQENEAAVRKENTDLKEREAAVQKENTDLKEREAAVQKENTDLKEKGAAMQERNEELQKREEAVRKELEALRDELQSARKESIQLEKTLAGIDDIDVRAVLQSLDNLYKEYIYVTGLSEKVDDQKFDKIVKSFNKETEKMRKPAYVARLQSMLDSRHGNIFTSLRRLDKSPKEPVLRMLAYIMVGFSPRTVSLLCDIKVDNYYNKVSRLKKDVKAADPDLYDRLLALLRANPFYTD